VTQIFLDDVGHRHAQRGGEILRGHGLLFFRILQKANQAIGQVARVAGLIKVDGQVFSLRHLAKIRKIGADDGDAIGASQVGHTTAPCRRGVWHCGHAGTLKKIRQIVLVNVASEFNPGIAHTPLSDRLYVACRLGMVAASDNELGLGKGSCN
jgi:hypothetical protein